MTSVRLNNPVAPRSVTLLTGVLLAGAPMFLVGCRGEISEKPPRQFFPDLDDQPKYKAQAESHFFREFYDEDREMWYGRTMRLPVEGTIPFGASPFVRAFEGVDFSNRDSYVVTNELMHYGGQPKTDDNGNVILDESGLPVMEQYLTRIPMPVTHDLIELGREKFEINCMICHGGLGDGQGLVGRRWSYALPSWLDAQYLPGGERGQDGLIYFAIRNGVGNPGGSYPLKMPSYARKLSEEESWAIVAYIRALQRSQRAGLEDVPPGQRADLQAQAESMRRSDQPTEVQTAMGGDS